MTPARPDDLGQALSQPSEPTTTQSTFLLPLKHHSSKELAYNLYARKIDIDNSYNKNEFQSAYNDRKNNNDGTNSPSAAVSSCTSRTKTLSSSSSIVTIVVHGGPGLGDSSESFEGLKELNNFTNLLFFDQLGCGNSDKPQPCQQREDEDDEAEVFDYYSLQGHVQQLQEVIEYCRSRYDRVGVLGHSWGGQVLLEWLLTTTKTSSLDEEDVVGKDTSVDFAVISNAPLHEQKYQEHQQALRSRLEADVQAFYEAQDELLAQDTSVGAQIYHRLIGHSELRISGDMKGWSVLDRLELMTRDNTLATMAPCLFLVTKDDTVPYQDYEHLPQLLISSSSNPRHRHQVTIMEQGGHGPFFGPTAKEYQNIVQDFVTNQLSVLSSSDTVV